MKGEDCCPLLQWITPIDFCKNGLAAHQTVTAGKVHVILFGRGGTPPSKFKSNDSV